MVPRVNKADERLFESRVLGKTGREDLRSYWRKSLDRGREGILDRSAVVERLHEEMERRSVSLRGFSLIFVGIQRVLLCNDTHGSPSDGQVLQAVAEKLQRNFRAADFLARSGNHGLVVFLPRTSTGAANTVATRLREEINATEFYCGSVAFKVKAGLAVASVQAEDTIEALLDRADLQHAPSE